MAKSKLKKGVTIDELAVMVQNGFSGLDGRMDGLEGRMTSLEKDLYDLRIEMRSKFAALDRRLDTFANHERRIARLERIIENLASK